VQAIGLLVAMVGVVEADGAVVEEQGAVLGQRPALGVASQVKGDAAAAGVGGVDLDVPVLAIQGAQQRGPVRGGLAWWQAQLGAVEQGKQASQELAAEQALQRLEREQEAISSGTPAQIRGQAAGGDQGVDVRVVTQVAAPGMQGHEQARGGTQMTRICQEFEQGVTHGVEEQLDETFAVELPQEQQLMRQGEDDVEMRARQETAEFGVDPACAGTRGAARTTAMAAGVELLVSEVTLRAAKRVAAAG